MSKTIDQLKKLHQAQAITKKDFSIKALFENNKAAKPYQNDDGTATLEIVGFSSKLVPRYISETNAGYHTTVFLKDGKKTGAFSGALLELASFFYQAAQLDVSAPFNQIMFNESDFVKVKVSKVDLSEGHMTYNFELVDGQLDKGVEILGALSGQSVPLLFAGNEAEEEIKTAGEDEA